MREIYDFIRRHRIYNHRVQSGIYNEWLSPWNNSTDKTISLLHHVVNTQSQPKLDCIHRFWLAFNNAGNPVNSFNDLLIRLGGNADIEPTYLNLYNLLWKKPGWGHKTAALFTKMVYHTHTEHYQGFSFLQDAPVRLVNGDHLFLPVDNVIENIFSRLNIGISVSFNGINNHLADQFGWNSMEIWDDLWFWGFITQKKGSMNFGFNEPKYWALLHAPKDSRSIAKIENLAGRFADLIQ